MTTFTLALGLSAFTCALVAGFLFAYAVVIMPGIRNLDDRQFITAFQVTDRVIQNNQPLFLLVWVGSAIAVIACVATGIAALEGVELVVLLSAAAAYLVGVQGSTIVVHLPLNNMLQTLDVDSMDAVALHEARMRFEPRWNRFNQIRTAIACGASAAFIFMALGL